MLINWAFWKIQKYIFCSTLRTNTVSSSNANTVISPFSKTSHCWNLFALNTALPSTHKDTGLLWWPQEFFLKPCLDKSQCPSNVWSEPSLPTHRWRPSGFGDLSESSLLTRSGVSWAACHFLIYYLQCVNFLRKPECRNLTQQNQK